MALVLPTPLTRIAEKLQDWTATLIDLEKHTNLAKVAMGVFGVSSAAAGAKAAAGFGKVLGIVPKNASFWETALGLGEFALAGAAVLGLGLVLEDLWVGMKGGESATRDWLDEVLGADEATAFFDGLNKVVDECVAAFEDLGPTLAPVLKDLGKLAVDIAPSIAKAFVWVTKAIAGAVRLLAGFGEGVAKTVGAVTKLIDGDNSGIDSLGKDLGGIVDRAGDSVFGRGGLFDMSQSNKVTDWGVPATMVGSSSVPFGPPTAAQVNQQNKIEVNITGATDPKATEDAARNGVEDALQAHMDNAMAAGLGGS